MVSDEEVGQGQVSDEEVGQGQVQVALLSWQVGFDSLAAEVKVHLAPRNPQSGGLGALNRGAVKAVPQSLVGFGALTAEVTWHKSAPWLLASPWHVQV